MGKSKGGLTTKIHATVDALGNPVRILLSEGLEVKYIIADKAYDGNSFLTLAKSQSEEVVVPSKANRSEQREIDKHVYKERHLVECLFAKIKVTFHAIVTIAACLVWLQ